MKIKLINLLSGVAFFMLASFAFGQQHYPTDAITTDWTMFKQERGINFYVKKQDISYKEGALPVTYVVVKLENTTDKDAKLLYNLAVFYNKGCNNCGNSQEYRKLVEVSAHSSIEGKVENGNSPIVSLLVNPNLNNGYIPEAIAVENLILNF
jgi:hypothetical protein